MVKAAAGGTGGLSLQMCKHLGATVIRKVSTRYKVEIAKKHRCDYIILYKDIKVWKRIIWLTDGKGCHAVRPNAMWLWRTQVVDPSSNIISSDDILACRRSWMVSIPMKSSWEQWHGWTAESISEDHDTSMTLTKHWWRSIWSCNQLYDGELIWRLSVTTILMTHHGLQCWRTRSIKSAICVAVCPADSRRKHTMNSIRNR